MQARGLMCLHFFARPQWAVLRINHDQHIFYHKRAPVFLIYHVVTQLLITLTAKFSFFKPSPIPLWHGAVQKWAFAFCEIIL